MKRIHIFVLLTLSLIIISCGRSQEKLQTLVLHPHEELPANIDKKSFKSVFLAGTIDMGSGVDWQKDVADFFEKSPGNWMSCVRRDSTDMTMSGLRARNTASLSMII